MRTIYLMLRLPDEAHTGEVTSPRALGRLLAEGDHHPLPTQGSFFSQHSESPIRLYSENHFTEECGAQLKNKRLFLLLNPQHITTLTFQKLSFKAPKYQKVIRK